MRIDEPELRGWHPERNLGGGDPKIARQRELQPTPDRVAVERRDRRVRVGLERVERGRKRVRNELLRLLGENAAWQVTDVVAGGERVLLAGHDHAPGLECREGGREAVEDGVIERAALAGI